MSAYSYEQAGAQFALCAHPAFQVGETLAVSAQPALQAGAPLAMGAQPAMPVGAQPEMFAADWDKDDANALVKLASRARFSELAGNKIKGFVPDLELYLRPVHHWGYFLLASLGAEKAAKVRRSHLADSIADFQKFKSGVEAMLGKFEFEGSYRAQLRTHAQSGAESIAAYAARTTDVCSRAYPRSRRIHSFRLLFITSLRACPTLRRAITCCMTARAARSHRKELCRWRKLAKRRASRCTHPRSLLQLQVRRSTRPHSPNARARTMRSPQGLHGKRRVDAMGV